MADASNLSDVLGILDAVQNSLSDLKDKANELSG